MTEVELMKIGKVVVKLGIFIIPTIYYKALGTKRAKALERFQSAFDHEDNETALWHIDKYIEDHPKDFGGYLYKGIVLKELKNLEEAAEQLSIAIERRHKVHDAHKLLADCLLELGRFKEAEASYKEAIRIDKKRLPAHFNKGINYMHQEQYESAIKAFQYVLKKEKGDKTYIYEELAAAYLIVGDESSHRQYTSLAEGY